MASKKLTDFTSNLTTLFAPLNNSNTATSNTSIIKPRKLKPSEKIIGSLHQQLDDLPKKKKPSKPSKASTKDQLWWNALNGKGTTTPIIDTQSNKEELLQKLENGEILVERKLAKMPILKQEDELFESESIEPIKPIKPLLKVQPTRKKVKIDYKFKDKPSKSRFTTAQHNEPKHHNQMEYNDEDSVSNVIQSIFKRKHHYDDYDDDIDDMEASAADIRREEQRR